MAQSPLHIKNTNDASKSFWTYEKKKIEQFLSKIKPAKLFIIHGNTTPSEFDLLSGLLSDLKKCFLVRDFSFTK